MNKKDIQIGKKYTNPMYPSTVYMGIALQDQKGNGRILRKELVIISPGLQGMCVVKNDGNKDFWSKFRLTNS